MSAEELGKINKPKADHAQKSKKIYLVPLIINYFPDIEEFTSLLTEYWKACDNQINKLETQAGTVSKIFHEGVWSDGKEGLNQIGSLNKFCLDLINSTDRMMILKHILEKRIRDDYKEGSLSVIEQIILDYYSRKNTIQYLLYANDFDPKDKRKNIEGFRFITNIGKFNRARSSIG